MLELDPWYAPRRTYFGAALYTKGATIELDNLELIDGTGQNKLRNGDFSQAQDFWFFSSDRDHLPWHIKNLFLNVLFDQGLLGLLAFLLFFVAAAMRALKYVHDTVYAPYLLSALAGFFVVGLFDSLLDVPRLATLFFLMCFMMLVLSPVELRARRPLVHSGNVKAGTANADKPS
jgi:O-antigen ligase